MTTRFTKETVDRWTGLARQWLETKAEYNLTIPFSRFEIQTGRDAWSVASACGILREAYADRTVTDGHIQTALEKIFPNAVFKDSKRY